MLEYIFILIDVISLVLILKFFTKYVEEIDEEITDMEMRISHLDVKNVKLENEIENILQSLKQKI